MTLFPFNFSYKDDSSITYIFTYFYNPTINISISDFILNIVLFIPFGFSFTCLLLKSKLSWIIILAMVLLFSFSLSLTIEVLQIFLPFRSPSLTDILTNTLGGLLGFYLLRLRVFNQLSKILSLKVLTVCFIGYLCLTFLISITLPSITDLSNWNPSFSLLLGNELTGDRPWQGYISDISFIDKTISEPELALIFSEAIPLKSLRDSPLAFYQLTGQGNYRDRMGNLPNLSWQGKQLNSIPEDHNIAFLTPERWLATEKPASFVTEKIRQTSQFTLIATIATASTNQAGPARIISLSENPYQSNFILGQEDSSLVFRLRTPVTGKNGANPELIVPGVFADTKFHRLVISYADSVLKLYVDKSENFHYIELTPGTALFSYIFPRRAYSSQIFKSSYYGAIFIPLGFFLGAIAIKIYRGKLIFHIIFFSGGILLPSFLLESILVFGGRRNFCLENVLLSMGIMLAAMLTVRALTRFGLSGRSRSIDLQHEQ
jgi:glycopeptide antibiotics resistance protein